jgi:hypothetical protein
MASEGNANYTGTKWTRRFRKSSRRLIYVVAGFFGGGVFSSKPAFSRVYGNIYRAKRYRFCYSKILSQSVAKIFVGYGQIVFAGRLLCVPNPSGLAMRGGLVSVAAKLPRWRRWPASMRRGIVCLLIAG